MHRRGKSDTEEEGPAWPGLVDLFAFGMAVMTLLWIMSLVAERSRGDQARKQVKDLTLSLQERLNNRKQKALEMLKDIPGLSVKDPESPDGILRLDIVAHDGILLQATVPSQDKVTFVTQKYDLEVGKADRIVAVARAMKSRGFFNDPARILVVEGEADPRPFLTTHGVPRDNVDLSALRAATVSKLLLQAEIPANQIEVVGLGARSQQSARRVGETLEEYERRLEEFRRVRLSLRFDLSRAQP